MESGMTKGAVSVSHGNDVGCATKNCGVERSQAHFFVEIWPASAVLENGANFDEYEVGSVDASQNVEKSN